MKRCLFGSWMTGQTDTTAEMSVKLEEIQQDALLMLHVQGTAVSHPLTTHSPAKVYGTERSTFTRSIGFVPRH